MKTFNEFDEKGQMIATLINTALEIIEVLYKVHFRQPRHDIVRRLQNEIVEFEGLGEGGKS